MNVTPTGWGILAGSILAAILVDFGVVQLLLEFLKPTTAYVFWIGRAGKITAVAAWLLFFDEFWYPQFLFPGQAVPGWVSGVEWAVMGALVLAAFVTVPRSTDRSLNRRG